MVRFVTGLSPSNNTKFIYDDIIKNAENGENTVLIAPEQYSFECEKSVLEIVTDNPQITGEIEVLPFSRMYETLGRLCGGICGKVLSESDKIIIMSRAIKEVSDELLIWNRCADMPEFAESMVKNIDELKYADISAAEINECAQKTENGKLKSKLFDTAKIFERYISLLVEDFIDPADYMDKLYEMLKSNRYFDGKTVFFDGFRSFSGQQLKVVRQIINSAKIVTFSFIDDTSDKRDFSMLKNVRKTMSRIKKMVNSSETEEINIQNKEYEIPELQMLNEGMFYGEFPNLSEKSDEPIKENIVVISADTIFDEVEFVARNIRKIINDSVSSNGQTNVKALDFIVIARDTAVYEDALSIACKRNGIDVFIDKKLSLIEMPIAVAALKAMEFAVRPSVKSIIDFYKTGICGLKADEISVLENYTYLWGLTVKDFDEEWDMNPSGFDTELKETDKSELKTLNEIRVKAIEPLNKFRREFKNTSASDMAKAVYNLVSSDCIKENLLSLYKENNNSGNEIYAAAIKKSYSALVSALDSIVTCYTRSNVAKAEFMRSFENALKLETVGVTPQKDNQIIFGGADRVITNSPSYVFVMGANQGTFPKVSANTGLFSDIDIETLNEMGLNIPLKTVDFALEEELLVYLNVTSATKKVFISFSKLKPDNTSAFPSPFVSQIKRLKVDERREPDCLSKANLPQTFDASKNELLKRLNDGDGGAKTIENAIEGTDEQEWLSNYKKIKTTAEEAKIDSDIAEKYFGNEIFLSASSIEYYNKCQFAYFCEKIAKAKPKKRVEITAMNRGLIAHYVLENFIKDHTEKGDIKTVCQDDIEKEVDLLTNEYLNSIKGFIKKQDYSSEYAVKTLKRTLVDYLIRAVEDFANSDFLPIEYEYKIGRDATPQYIIDIDDTGKKIKLNGSIDRVDCYDKKIRIIDYKTGKKGFELCEIPHGKNMQTLIYLNAYLKNNTDTDKAGFIYSKLERLKGNKEDPQCLIVDDGLIISAMDNNETRKFIPEHKTKKTDKVGNKDRYLKEDKYDTLLNYVEGKIIETGKSLYEGNIKPKPLKSGQSIQCDYCEYSKICGVKNKNPIVLSTDDVKLIFCKEE